MHIGINASFLRKPGTGIGQVTCGFLETLVRSEQAKRHVFSVYCEEEPRLDFPVPDNFHVRAFLPVWKRDDLARKWLWERQVAREAARDGCETLVSLYQAATVAPKGMRHVMIVHDIIPGLFPEYRGNMRQVFHWRMAERGMRAADRIIAVSQSTRHDLIVSGILPEAITVAYPDAARRFHTIPSAEAVAGVLEKYGLQVGYIYHGGGLEVRKNAERFLQAYAKLIGKDASVPQLVVSGKIFPTSNTLATDVEGLVKELGLEGKVRLLGFVPDEDLPALYRGALCFVYPSLYEGFGLPVLEALRMGVPVLTSETSSLLEIGGEAVLYCDPQSVDDIAGKMARLISDAALRETLVSKSAAQAAQFSWESFTEKVFEAVEQ
jgi:glycosyltransferase involved in cell wall biosynthesis